MRKDTFYFSHDYNARNDPKIKALIRKQGLYGYGLFWAIVEDLYNNANALPTDYESIAFDLRTDLETVKSIINDFDLFVIDGQTFGSLSIERRIEERNEKSSKARVSAEKRWEKHRQKNANAMQTHSKGNAIKESKEKDIKESKETNVYRSFLHLSISHEEFEKLKIDYHEHQVISILDAIENYKDNKKYKSLYLTAKTWLSKEPKRQLAKRL